jgi:tRNA U34 2-thiouridine synthase MnmA/TrmU
VLSTDPGKNTVTVGSREDLAASSVRVRDVVLHRDGHRVDRVRLRYRSAPVQAAVEGGATAGRHTELRLALGEPFQGPAPGQAAVLLDGEAIVGHGKIAPG